MAYVEDFGERQRLEISEAMKLSGESLETVSI
jgi:hypothetical protein